MSANGDGHEGQPGPTSDELEWEEQHWDGLNWFEQPVEQLPEVLTRPRPGECLVCYLSRMQDFGCRRHGFTDHYVRLRAPGATGLRQRLAGMGACCCECEVFLNAYEPAYVPDPWSGTAVYDWEDLMDEAVDVPACRGVRGGSTQPCRLWKRI